MNNDQRPKLHSGREFTRFVEHVGSLKEAAEYLDCTPDQLSKLRKGDREIMARYVRKLFQYPGFRLSFKRLFDLD